MHRTLVCLATVLPLAGGAPAQQAGIIRFPGPDQSTTSHHTIDEQSPRTFA